MRILAWIIGAFVGGMVAAAIIHFLLPSAAGAVDTALVVVGGLIGAAAGEAVARRLQNGQTGSARE